MASCSAVGSAPSEGSPVAVGDATLTGPRSLPHPTSYTLGPKQKYTHKLGPGLVAPRPLAFIHSEFVNLMASQMCRCWEVGGWPAPLFLSFRSVGNVNATPPCSCYGKEWGFGSHCSDAPCHLLRGLWNQTPAPVAQGNVRMNPRQQQRPLSILTPSLHGAWPTPVLYPFCSPGLDCLSFTGQPALPTAHFDKDFLSFFVVCGRG